jgi:hypothetical protein
MVVVSGKPCCLNETKERSVPEELLRPSLEGAHHYAYVVESIEATVERLAEQLGAGPFFLSKTYRSRTSPRGVSRRSSSITRRSATAAAARSS